MLGSPKKRRRISHTTTPLIPPNSNGDVTYNPIPLKPSSGIGDEQTSKLPNFSRQEDEISATPGDENIRTE